MRVETAADCVIDKELTPDTAYDGDVLATLTSRYNSSVSLRSMRLEQCKPPRLQSVSIVRAVGSTAPISMLRRALYGLAPERGQVSPTGRLERRGVAERRQLLTAIAPADDRRKFNRRELDRLHTSMNTATPIERTLTPEAFRKGLLLDVYV